MMGWEKMCSALSLAGIIVSLVKVHGEVLRNDKMHFPSQTIPRNELTIQDTSSKFLNHFPHQNFYTEASLVEKREKKYPNAVRAKLDERKNEYSNNNGMNIQQQKDKSYKESGAKFNKQTISKQTPIQNNVKRSTLTKQANLGTNFMSDKQTVRQNRPLDLMSKSDIRRQIVSPDSKKDKIDILYDKTGRAYSLITTGFGEGHFGQAYSTNAKHPGSVINFPVSVPTMFIPNLINSLTEGLKQPKQDFISKKAEKTVKTIVDRLPHLNELILDVKTEIFRDNETNNFNVSKKQRISDNIAPDEHSTSKKNTTNKRVHVPTRNKVTGRPVVSYDKVNNGKIYPKNNVSQVNVTAHDKEQPGQTAANNNVTTQDNTNETHVPDNDNVTKPSTFSKSNIRIKPVAIDSLAHLSDKQEGKRVDSYRTSSPLERLSSWKDIEIVRQAKPVKRQRTMTHIDRLLLGIATKALVKNKNQLNTKHYDNEFANYKRNVNNNIPNKQAVDYNVPDMSKDNLLDVKRVEFREGQSVVRTRIRKHGRRSSTVASRSRKNDIKTKGQSEPFIEWISKPVRNEPTGKENIRMPDQIVGEQRQAHTESTDGGKKCNKDHDIENLLSAIQKIKELINSVQDLQGTVSRIERPKRKYMMIPIESGSNPGDNSINHQAHALNTMAETTNEVNSLRTKTGRGLEGQYMSNQESNKVNYGANIAQYGKQPEQSMDKNYNEPEIVLSQQEKVTVNKETRQKSTRRRPTQAQRVRSRKISINKQPSKNSGQNRKNKKHPRQNNPSNEVKYKINPSHNMNKSPKKDMSSNDVNEVALDYDNPAPLYKSMTKMLEVMKKSRTMVVPEYMKKMGIRGHPMYFKNR